ncbi:MAG: carboxypeptidase regulatory-like domain-containing protein [Anaerolineales bacterium]|nr:carboxypeptidase regulatory-like domain-containing protein [Anaerolineales bacterium]
MKLKSMIHIAMLLAMLVGLLGTGTPAQALGNTSSLGAQIVIRSTAFWDAVFSGTVNSTRYERWSLQLDESEYFSVSVTTVTGDLTPDIYFLDADGNEITHAAGTLSDGVLNTNQPAGTYFVQVQPQTGGGTYSMSIRKTEAPVLDPNSNVVLNPANVLVGESSTATVLLNNVPETGYASAEFTCSYNPALLEVSNIAESGLFGTDAVLAINGPQNGLFIVAIAGSNGQKAVTSGAVFAFSVKALAAGQAEVRCDARVSAGNSLTSITSTPATLGITEAPPAQATLTGTVIATKGVIVTLIDQVSETSAAADANGNFSIIAPAGSYTVVASAPGFLKAQGTPTLTAGVTTTMQTITLLAGDIDGNDVIDQFDALTIGINYNASSPAAADLNNDGTINVLDLEMLAANYRQSGALAWQ